MGGDVENVVFSFSSPRRGHAEAAPRVAETGRAGTHDDSAYEGLLGTSGGVPPPYVWEHETRQRLVDSNVGSVCKEDISKRGSRLGQGERLVSPTTVMQSRGFMSCGMGFLAYFHAVGFLGNTMLHVIQHTSSCITCPFGILNLYPGVGVLIF